MSGVPASPSRRPPSTTSPSRPPPRRPAPPRRRRPPPRHRHRSALLGRTASACPDSAAASSSAGAERLAWPAAAAAQLPGDRGRPERARDRQRHQRGQLVPPGELVQVRAEQHGDRAPGDQQAGQREVPRIAPAEGEDPGDPGQQCEQEHRSRRVPAVQLVVPQRDGGGPQDPGFPAPGRGEQAGGALRAARGDAGRVDRVGVLELPALDRGVTLDGVPGQGEDLDRVPGDVAGHPHAAAA